MSASLVLLVAGRYLRTRRREKGFGSSLLSVLGIAVGVMTLTVVLAVMNGFQLGFIESIVEVSSYHIQLAADGPGKRSADDASIASALRAVASVTAVVPFVERQALLEGPFARARVCSVRAVPPSLFTLDPSQEARILIQEGAFAIGDGRSIVIGTELSAATGARVGDALDIVSLGRGSPSGPEAPGGIVPRRSGFTVTGVFKTGYYDFDAGLVFVSLEAADALFGGGKPLPRTWGVKIADRFADARALAEIQRLPEAAGWIVESWRRYNRSFFDALFMEKLMMMLLVGLIFVVVGFNVYNSLRRTVFEKMEEIALLKAVGIPPFEIQGIFVLEGLLIGLIGAAVGLLLGLLLSVNIDAVFAVVEAGVNGALAVGSAVLSPLVPLEGGRGFSIFSPMYFYLTSVPSRVLPREAFLVVFFALLACGGAAGAASRAVSGFRPAEVLRYE
ncbi:MAG: ABC transporter permease [Spirochaetes bacterium]|nr:ABC transporter permease [Acidobacteriota bacterium]MCX7039334.1 ABC transporter permease [Spirochaetota bacterium]